MSNHTTAPILIAYAKAYIAADAAIMSKRPAGMPKAAWRQANPLSLPISFQAVDTAFKTRPARTLNFDINGNPYDLWVWGKTHVIERINLRAADAAARLARYEVRQPGHKRPFAKHVGREG